VVGDQPVQRRPSLDPLGQPPAGKSAAVVVDDLEVVMAWAQSSPIDNTLRGFGRIGIDSVRVQEEKTVSTQWISAYDTPFHRPSAPPHQPAGARSKTGLDERIRDTQCSPGGGSGTRSTGSTDKPQDVLTG
jgi:hypothetical protein